MRERVSDEEDRPEPVAPELLEQLDLWSRGYQFSEIESRTSLSTSQIKRQRKKLRTIVSSGQGRYVIAQAIQNRQLPIEVHGADQDIRLTPAEEVVLRLAALGYDDEAIAKRRGSSRHIINGLESTLCGKLGARSMTHAIRRAFEVGKFTIGEPILDPDEQLDIDRDRYRLVVDGTVRRLGDLGLRNMREIELILLFRKLDRGFFDIMKMYGLDFFKDAPTPQSRAAAFSRSASHITERLEDSFDQPVIKAAKIRGRDGRFVRYTFLKSLGIGAEENLHVVPRFQSSDIDRVRHVRQSSTLAGRRNSKQQAATEAVKTKPYIKREPTPPESHANNVKLEELSNIEAADLTNEFLEKLALREESEVARSFAIRSAVSNILKENNLPYRDKFLLALRYGIKLHPRYEPLSIARNGVRRTLTEILANTPDFRGLDIGSVSKILGYHPAYLLSLEHKLLQLAPKNEPAVQSLMDKLEKQKQDLLAKESKKLTD